jgi:hypothetical protein
VVAALAEVDVLLLEGLMVGMAELEDVKELLGDELEVAAAMLESKSEELVDPLEVLDDVIDALEVTPAVLEEHGVYTVLKKVSVCVLNPLN